jgi:hypothetical protein
MTKDKYFNDAESAAVNEKLFITEKTDLLDKEISENLWAFGITQELADRTDPSDFLELFDKIKADRQQQLDNCDKAINLIYYLWHDEQAGQLRLNFINSNHAQLPFGCELEYIETEREIITAFLKSKYLDDLPMNELEVVDGEDDDIEQEQLFRLKVYTQTLINKNE